MKASCKYLRTSPQKVRAVINLVRGKGTDEAVSILKFCPRRPARPVLKLISSAIANAKAKAGVAVDNLYIGRIVVSEGPTVKRWRARSRGMAHPILKRSCHIEVELKEK